MKKIIPIRKVGGAIVKKYFRGGDFDFDKTERNTLIDRSDELFDRPDLPTSNNNYFSDNLQRQMIDTRRRNNIRTSRYDAAARKVGLNTTEDIIAWQRANGLEADGLFGAKSQAMWNRLHARRNRLHARRNRGSMLRVDTSPSKQTPTYISAYNAPVFNYATIKDYMDAVIQEQNAKPNQYAGYPASVLSLIVENNIKKANAQANNAIKISRQFGDILRYNQTARNPRALVRSQERRKWVEKRNNN